MFNVSVLYIVSPSIPRPLSLPHLFSSPTSNWFVPVILLSSQTPFTPHHALSFISFLSFIQVQHYDPMLAAESSSNWQTIKLKSHHEYIQCNSVRIDDDLSDIEDVVTKWCM